MPQRAGSKARPCLSSFIFLPFGASSVLVHDPPALRLGCLRHQLAISQAAPPRRDAQGNQLHIRHPCPSSLYLSPAGRGQSVTARLFPGVGGQYPSSIASKLSNSWVLYWPGNHLSSRTSMGTDQTGAACWVLTRTRNRRAGAPLQGCDPPPAQSFPQFLQIPGGEQACPSAHVLGFGRSTRSKVITHTHGLASQP